MISSALTGLLRCGDDQEEVGTTCLQQEAAATALRMRHGAGVLSSVSGRKSTGGGYTDWVSRRTAQARPHTIGGDLLSLLSLVRKHSE